MRLRTSLPAILATLAALVCATNPQAQQRTGTLKTTVFAVKNAQVVVKPGVVLPRATVVVRDGLLAAVGPDVAVPADATVLDGAGLTVYPGLIDGLSHWGFDPGLRRSEAGPPAPEDMAADALIATKADNRKGVTPEFEVRTALRDEEQADAWRRLGFTARLVGPEGGLFAGQGALVALSGTVPRESVLRPAVVQHAGFRMAFGGDYPRTLMGAMAHIRQTLLDAGHHARTVAAFEKAGGVGRRPVADPAYDALNAVLTGKQPLLVEADGVDEIDRALDLFGEFGVSPWLFGGRDAGKAIDRLRKGSVPLVLRVPSPDDGGERAKSWPQRARDDRTRRNQEAFRTAGELHKAGIRFCLSTAGQQGERPWESFKANLRKVIEAGLPSDAALAAFTTEPAKLFGVAGQVGSVEVGKAAHLVVTEGDLFADPATQVKYVFSDGVKFEYEVKPREKKEPGKQEAKKDEKPAEDPDTELDADRVPKVRTGGEVLIRGATLLTVADGTKRADLLVRGGKIAAVGEGLKAPDDVKVIDAAGMFVMPGIIDTHCHFAMDGGVNESSLSVVPEVRVRDIVDSEDVQIYRALAGGVTLARLLHGSANVVGGQDAVIKLKWGRPARDLLLVDAPRGVKFALGENVKRTDGRFPNSRLGVEAVLVRAFSEAQAYRKTWKDYADAKASGRPLPEPRRDLRLEALADVLVGDLRVHCHCYRSDEILMLLRTADRFGFKVRSLQHVLEGYKVAPEIAAHGASCSTFADWWAYKIEAYDAIPFNTSILTEAGAMACLKSDSHELMRHLYQEAAKCVKYGGMSENDALKTITLNGAKQLGLEKRTGSIEVGKDADLAIFNGHPLNGFSRCEMTLVEGEVYFQRSEKLVPFAPAAIGPTPPAKPVPAITPNPAGKYVLTGVTVHPVRGEIVPDAAVVIEKGRVARIIGNISRKEIDFGPGVTVTDLAGLHVYPGMIDAGTVIGLTELGSARETHDYSDSGDFQPDLRAATGVNPDSELIPVTRANGVTTVVTRPTGGVVAGQAALLNLAGWTPAEMTIAEPIGLSVEFPAGNLFFTGDPTAPAVGRALAKRQREEKIRRLKELFRQAAVYEAARKANPASAVNPRLEALVPYARGEQPLIVQAFRKAEIVDALALADELKLKIILSGAADAWKVADELKKRDVPVIVGPVMTMPQENFDRYDAPFTNIARLHAAGVRFCIRSSGGANSRNLPYETAMAVSYGLPPEEGLKAVTLYPAQILGVDKDLGSVEPGKRANLVVTNGDILQPSTQVLSLFIDGKPFAPESKQTRLADRYRQRLAGGAGSREAKTGEEGKE